MGEEIIINNILIFLRLILLGWLEPVKWDGRKMEDVWEKLEMHARCGLGNLRDNACYT
jgi:hypothetical protein